MGRSVFVDGSVQTYIDQLVKENKWFTGVIIGKSTTQRDYVIHVARTPDPVEDKVIEENGDADSDNEGSKPKKNVMRPTSMEQLDEKWVSTHAKQVSRMLPGGLAVIGLFVLAPTTTLQANQVKLKQMMFSVHKSLTKNPLLVSPNEITDKILLQVDLKTMKLTCTSLDISDGKNNLRPAEWKYQSAASQWTQMDSVLSLDIPLVVPKGSKSHTSLLKQLQGGLSDFCQSVRQAVISIDDTIRDGSEPLFVQVERKQKRGGKDQGKGDQEENVISKVQIYLPFPSSNTEEDPIHCTSPTTLRMCGTVTIRAFVPAKASVSDACEAVKTDIIKSLYARCELLCEEDDVTEDKEDSSVYDPPVRYYCSSPNSMVDFCDYAFQDEKQEEILQRIQELLDISVDQLETVEAHATEDDTWSFVAPGPEEFDHGKFAVQKSTTAGGVVKAYFGAAIGGLIAIVASGISYMYLSD